MDEQAVVIDDLSTGLQRRVPDSVPLIVGNCGNEGLLQNVFRQHDITAIIHAAASTVVSESVANPERYHRNNFVNACILVETVRRAGIKDLIFSSTAGVYGEVDVIPVTEAAATRPISRYGRSKLLAEQLLQARIVDLGLQLVPCSRSARS